MIVLYNPQSCVEGRRRLPLPLLAIGSQLPVPYAIKGTITLEDGTTLPFARTGRIPVVRFDSVGTRPQ